MAQEEMKYMSTRGGDERLSFEDTVLTGLAPNGGLYVPCYIPNLPTDWKSKWSTLSFTELAVEVYSLFIPTSSISRQDLIQLVNKSYSTFRHPKICPIRQTRSKNKKEFVLELFHGPTFAFKDVALQFLGNLFEFLLARKNSNLSHDDVKRSRLTVVGATSGDTGSAAIYGLRGKQDVTIFILYPRGKVSSIQEAQMTTVLDQNVHNLSCQGTFDDCQDIVKTLFGDAEFNAKHNLGAVNSINWARILAQIVYYFSSYFQVCQQMQTTIVKLQFVVPTGNFGDILAGWYAKRLGLPMDLGHTSEDSPSLVIATNANDILARFFQTGTYQKADSGTCTTSSSQTQPVNGSTDGGQGVKSTEGVKETLSPAMDILVSSNFERLLFHLALESVEGATVKSAQGHINEWMQSLKTKGWFTVPSPVIKAARSEFGASRVSDEETRSTIREYFVGTGVDGGRYVVDPHTAVGLSVANRLRSTNDEDVVQVVLATAHPAKFSEAVSSSIASLAPSVTQGFDFAQDVLPEEFRGLLERERRVEEVETEGDVRRLIERESAGLFGQGDATASV